MVFDDLARQLKRIEDQNAEILALLKANELPAGKVFDAKVAARKALEDFQRKNGKGRASK